MKSARPFVLLAVAVVLAPLAEASRTTTLEPSSAAAVALAKVDATTALTAIAPASGLETSRVGEPVLDDRPRFDLGDVSLAQPLDERVPTFHLGAVELLVDEPPRGPPASYPETRVRGLELSGPFRVGASPALSLWSHQACGFSCPGIASDSRQDPWGLRAATRADEAQRAAILAAIEGNRREAVKDGLHGSAMEDYEEAARFTLSNFDAAIEAAGTSDPVGITDNKLFGGANGGGTYGYEFGVLPRGGGAGDIAGMTIDGALQDSAVVIARIPEFLPIVPGAKSARARRTVKGPARREVPRERYTRELPPGERRSADENALAREYYRNHRDKAIGLYEKETGLQWPRDPQTGKPLWAEHPRSLKEGGNPLRVEPGNGADPNAPHSVPGPDGLTDHQRWGALGTPAREARRRGN